MATHPRTPNVIVRQVFLVLAFGNQVLPPSCWSGSIRRLLPHKRPTTQEATHEDDSAPPLGRYQWVKVAVQSQKVKNSPKTSKMFIPCTVLRRTTADRISGDKLNRVCLVKYLLPYNNPRDGRYEAMKQFLKQPYPFLL